MEKSLRRLEDLHVGRLCLLDGLVVLIAGLGLAGKGFVDLRKTVSEDREILLNFGLLLLLL